MKTEAEINAEKHAKPRVDIVPPALVLAAGRALGYGAAKHGNPEGYNGFGTWRVAGTQQAEPLTHYACLLRHLFLWRMGEIVDPETGEWKVEHLEAAAAQLAILLDLVKNPPQPVNDPWKLPDGWTWGENVIGPYARLGDDASWSHAYWAVGDKGKLLGFASMGDVPREVVELVKRRNGVRA